MIGLAFISWVACQAVPPAFQVASLTLAPFCLLIMAAATADLTGLRSFVRHRALVRLGEWSFAFYLLHRLVLDLADRTFGLGGRPPFFILIAVPLLLVVSIAASATLFTYFERPLERRLRASGHATRSRASLGLRAIHQRRHLKPTN